MRRWLVLSTLLLTGTASAGMAQLLPREGELSGRGMPRRKLLQLPAAGAAVELAPDEAIRRASCGGKYRKLLAVISVPEDRGTYDAFTDYGRSNTASWGGYSGLPEAYWVYVYPHWYLWKDSTQAEDVEPKFGLEPRAATGRPWGPEQAVGEPDTEGAGDLTTAWASLTQDDQDEWLQLDYGTPIIPVAVVVHETYNPGALARVTCFRADSEEADAWKGTDPTPSAAEHGVSIVPIHPGFATQRIKLYLQSSKVPGWNEIDAVGLIDEMGKTHWAVKAEASSTYATTDSLETLR